MTNNAIIKELEAEIKTKKNSLQHNQEFYPKQDNSSLEKRIEALKFAIEIIKKMDNAVDEGYLQDWYIHSVSSDDPPVWTEEHIEELFNDFISIPRDVRLNELMECQS